MKTLTSPLQQDRGLQTGTGQQFVPAVTVSINEVLAMLSAATAVVAIVIFFVWVATLEMSDVLGAGIWGTGFIFFGLAVDNREPKAFLQLITGVFLLALAWLQTNVSPDFAIVSGALVAGWVATAVYKRLR